MKSWSLDIQYADQTAKLAAVVAPAFADLPLLVGGYTRIMIYGWHPTGAALHVEYPAETYTYLTVGKFRSNEYQREITDYVYGWGARTLWDLQGRAREYRDDYRFLPSKSDRTEYFSAYEQYTFRPDTAGDHILRFYFGDPLAPDAEATLTLTAIEVGGDEPEAPDPQLSLKRVDSNPIHPGEAHTVRVYYYHPEAATLNTWAMSGVTLSLSGSGTENVTETVQLRNGQGSTSGFDRNGLKDVDVPALAGQEIAYHDVTYQATYKDYDVTGALADTPYACLFYYDEYGEVGRVEQLYAFTAQDPAPGDYTDQTSCQSAGYYWYNDACHADPPAVVTRTIWVYDYLTEANVAGAYVAVNGVNKGQTDANGQIAVSGLVVGQTYTLEITKTGYIDSDLDEIANDSFTVQ